ncbi:holo-ACP synthase [Piscibacillus halophilus]|uniref:Holo-[acyl-carrier-protein] synthase n=1 Tax=Piscibacillus halophilus TaxID=571933 RepID=A0A1H9LQ43_9BACI|nr:holo-ACP synthase [Piscibacillus halophilus]SER13347.1 holo-[acyl-carrier-protein] synthase [Piscibacillus halophilus]
MIIGTGIDLVELNRIERLMNKNDKLVHRILSVREREKLSQYMNQKRKIEFLAGRFAAKEAYSKALGTGIGSQLSFQSIEIVSNEVGRPQIIYKGEVQTSAHVSISHSKEYAVAQVIIEK